MFKIYDGREQFYQWDLEQKLIVSDPTVNEVHFSHQVDSEALVCEVYELDGKRVVNVPNILLQEDWKINVYAYCSNYTKISACFKVIPKAKPADYIYTETEIKSYEAFEERLAALEEGGGGFTELTEGVELQRLPAGAYKVSVATGSNIKVMLGDKTSLTLRNGATLIVGGDTTINNHSSITYQPFKKTFLAIGYQTSNTSTSVRAGEVICKFVLDPESEKGSYYEYEVKQGNVLTVEDRTMNIDAENTAISNITTVKAVKDYVNKHGGARELDGSKDAFISELETGVYAFNGLDTGCCLWLDDYCEFGMLNGIAIITKDDEEVYEWMFVGLDQGYNTVSKKGNTYLDTEEECWTISAQGEVETKANQVNDLNEPDYWTYPTTKAVVDYIPTQLAEFKENEIPYQKIYIYDTEELANKLIWSNEYGYSYESNIYSGSDADGAYYNLVVEFNLVMVRKLGKNYPMEYMVDTPLVFEVEVRDTGYLDWKTLNRNIVDTGFAAEGETMNFTDLLNSLEESIYYNKRLQFNPLSTSQKDGSGVSGLTIYASIYSRNEEAITALKEDLDNIVAAYGAYIFICYENKVEPEVIEAQYRG